MKPNDIASPKAICFALLFGFTFFLFTTATAQTAKDIFTTQNLVYYGIDFSQAKMIGIKEVPVATIKDSLFNAWNQVILDEPKKFNLPSVFKKKNVPYDLSVVTRRNKAVPADTITGNEKAKYHIPSARFDSILKDYASGINKTGVGFVFFVEYFSKPEKEGKIHLVFFDIASGKVLMRKNFNEPAIGFGLKSYWVNTIYHVLKYIDEEGYAKWDKEEMKQP